MKTLKSIALLVFSGLALQSCSSTNSAGSGDRDGSSPEKAFKVKSVDEEYQIVRKLCPDCRMEGQSLISSNDDKKHYDVLTLVKPDGQKVSYYFDINSFYGKW